MSELEKISPDNSLSRSADLFQAGKQLQLFIKNNGLSTNIAGKEYAHVDAWKFAGSLFGLTQIVHKPERKHEHGVMMRIAFHEVTKQGRNGTWQKEETLYYGYIDDTEGYEIATKGKKVSREIVKPYFAYECDCEIVKLDDGKIVSTGTGFCSNLEASKALFDEYSVNSTAQTRSIGKAYRNMLGYIMNQAGYESTPAEEMEEPHIRENVKANSKAKSTKPTMSKGQLSKALLRVSKGEMKDLAQLEKHFEIEPDQRSALESMLNEVKSKKS